MTSKIANARIVAGTDHPIGLGVQKAFRACRHFTYFLGKNDPANEFGVRSLRELAVSYEQSIRQLRRTGEAEKAGKLERKLEPLGTRIRSAYLKTGDHCLKAGNYRSAEEAYKMALHSTENGDGREVEAKLANCYLSWALHAAQKGDEELAVDLGRKAAHILPDDNEKMWRQITDEYSKAMYGGVRVRTERLETGRLSRL